MSIISITSNCKIVGIYHSSDRSIKAKKDRTISKSAKTRRRNKKIFEGDPVAKSAYCGAYSPEEDRKIIEWYKSGLPIKGLVLPGRTCWSKYKRLSKLKKDMDDNE